MSENQNSDSKFLVGFLLGFALGMLLALGGGGTFAFMYLRQNARLIEAEHQARLEAEMAREMAERARMEAEKAKRAADEKDK